MKILMVFDQAQAGLGGKGSPDLTMGEKPMTTGSCHMSEKTLTGMGEDICVALYCGDGTFAQDPNTNGKRFAAMSKKPNPDVIICGPCLNYENYGGMTAKTTQTINGLTNIPALTIIPEEYGAAVGEFKDHVTILKVPKEGGTGLPQSLAMTCEFTLRLAKEEDISEMIREHAY